MQVWYFWDWDMMDEDERDGVEGKLVRDPLAEADDSHVDDD